MAPIRGSSKNKRASARAQPSPHGHGSNEPEAQSVDMQRHPLHVEIVAVNSFSDPVPAPDIVPTARRHRNSSRFTTLRTISHTKTTPQASAVKWTQRQTLTNQYDVHKRSTRIDNFAQQAVSGMNISRFVQPSSPTSHPGPPPEDLGYSLRRFIFEDPVQDANVVYTRIAIKEGQIMAGYAPVLPWLRCVTKREECFASEAEGDDSDGFGGQ